MGVGTLRRQSPILLGVKDSIPGWQPGDSCIARRFENRLLCVVILMWPSRCEKHRLFSDRLYYILEWRDSHLDGNTSVFVAFRLNKVLVQVLCHLRSSSLILLRTLCLNVPRASPAWYTRSVRFRPGSRSSFRWPLTALPRMSMESPHQTRSDSRDTGSARRSI